MLICECICNLNFFFFEQSPLSPSANCHSFCCPIHWGMQCEGLPFPCIRVNAPLDSMPLVLCTSFPTRNLPRSTGELWMLVLDLSGLKRWPAGAVCVSLVLPGDRLWCGGMSSSASPCPSLSLCWPCCYRCARNFTLLK